ncbi:MAG: tetratricopeptide repeat protein [Sedimentisphaerales bacterium]|nr:tetratricopeptide repeat protein [Sedimentisphaerales bacterium]
MDAAVQSMTGILLTDEVLSEEQFDKMVHIVRRSETAREQFQEQLRQMLAENTSTWSKNTSKAAKVGMAFYALGDYRSAFEWLEKADSSAGRLQLKGCCLMHLKRWDEAIATLEQWGNKGGDSFDMEMGIVDCLIQAGRVDDAAERLKRTSRIGEIRAEHHYQSGRLLDVNGDHEGAIVEFEKAVQLDGGHTRALFSLAYAYDLYGDEAKAMEYYRRCIDMDQVHINALLNLAVLYEDAEDYYRAKQCITRVLEAYPNHPRARMFLKDIDSSVTMYIDEEQEKRIDRRNQVLEIPISDFELSVRSRNCLKKMNIRVLGDLLRVTESDLLAYKNFGETSLQEIKVILNSKGLRLGQMLEEPAYEDEEEDAGMEEEDKAKNELMATPLSEVELSVRSRKCFQQLNIQTLGELAGHTEAELLGCKNFGMTSLLEIKQLLKDRGLSLRQLED